MMKKQKTDETFGCYTFKLGILVLFLSIFCFVLGIENVVWRSIGVINLCAGILFVFTGYLFMLIEGEKCKWFVIKKRDIRYYFKHEFSIIFVISCICSFIITCMLVFFNLPVFVSEFTLEKFYCIIMFFVYIIFFLNAFCFVLAMCLASENQKKVKK